MKKLANFFFKTVEVGELETPQSPQPVTFAQQPVQQQIPGQEDGAIKKQLLDALEQANLPGYDYFEFIKAIDVQATIIPSEAMRFQSTFAVATTMGVNVQTLLTSAQHYLEALSKKEKEFLEALEKHSTEAVGGKENQIATIDQTMQQKGQLIAQLTQEINDLQNQKTTLTNEISENKIKIDVVRNNFFATLKVIVGRITGDVEKIKQYLQTTTAPGGK